MSNNVNVLKRIALDALMDETFAYIKQLSYESYVALAKENSKLRYSIASFFIYQGTIYPDHTATGVLIKGINVMAPPLHFSLIEEFDQIKNTMDDSNETAIKNFFIAVLSNSYNKLVLDALIPAILIARLKKDLEPHEYDLVDMGRNSDRLIEPESATRENILKIQENYVDTIEMLRNLLMERFLLQG